MNIDSSILFFIQENLKCNFLDSIMPIISAIGNDGIFFILLGLFLVLFKKYRPCGVTILTALLFSFIICNVILKPTIARIRPFDIYPDVTMLIPKLSDFSFPSGHSSISFAFATSVFMYYKKTGIAACVLACLIAFSRLYLFVHYPTDVLAGIILGIFCGVTANWLIKQLIKKFAKDPKEN